MNDVIYIDNPMIGPDHIIEIMDISINNFHNKLQTIEIPKDAFKKSHYRALRIGSYDPSTMMTEDWPKEGKLIIGYREVCIEWWTSNGNIYGYMLIDKALES